MEKRKPNLVYAIFALLGMVIVSLVGSFKGATFIMNGGNQSDLGRGFMFIIVSALLLIGTVLNVIGEFTARKDANLVGTLINAIGFTVLLILETSSAVLPAFAAVTFFAYSILRVLDIYLDKKMLKIVALVLASITLFFLVLAGTIGLFAMNFSFYYVGYLFGYMFIGLAIFTSSLLFVVGKKESAE